MPVIAENTVIENNIVASLKKSNENHAKTAELKSSNTKITVNDQARFHIFSKNEKLTLDHTDVPHTNWRNWTNEDRTIDEIRDIIFGGRSLDPFPQESWNHKEIISSNWPDLKTTWGPINLDFTKSGSKQAIFIDSSSSEVGASYGIIPKGIITIDPQDESILTVFQVENVCSKIDKTTSDKYKWATWTIIPIKINMNCTADNPSELVAFPVAHADNQKLEDFSDSEKLNNKWNYCKIGENNFIILNPYVFNTNEAEKTFFSSTNWALIARKGSDQVILMRTVFNHKDQFQVYNGQPEYIELESTGPLVPHGEKSTVISKINFIPLNLFKGINFSFFGETTDLKQEIATLLKYLKQMETNNKLINRA